MTTEPHNLTAPGNRDSTFEFELKTEGVNLADCRVYFVLQDEGFNYELPCKKINETFWSITIPKKLSTSKNRQYTVCVIAEDFHFEPVKGDIKFINKDDVQVKLPNRNEAPAQPNIKTQPPVVSTPKEEPAPAETKEEPKKTVEEVIKPITDLFADLDIDDIVNKAVKEINDKPKKTIKEEAAPVQPKQDTTAKLKDILAEEQVRIQEKEEARKLEEKQKRDARQKAILEEHRRREAANQKIKAITKDYNKP